MNKTISKNDVKAIVNDEIKKYISSSLDNEMKKVLQSSNSKTRDEMIVTIKKALESVYKTLWVKRDFWKSEIR
jgi:hypothetical protein